MASEKSKPARLSVLGNHLRVAAIILIPLIFIFLLILPNFYSPAGTNKLLFGYQLGWVYAFCVTGVLWISNVIPIPVIGFVPLVVLPLVGISTSKKLADAFMTNVNMTTFGSLIFVLAIDATGLRERLSLRILKHSSGSFRWIFVYTFVLTALLAMWINAAAATFLMMKVVEGFLDLMKSQVASGALGEERMRASHLLLQTTPTTAPATEKNDKAAANEGMAKPEIEGPPPLPAGEEQGSIRGSVQPEEEDELDKTASVNSIPEDPVQVFETQNSRLVQDFGSELLYAVAVAANLSGTLWPHCSPMGAELFNNKVAITFKSPLVFGWTEASWMTYSFPLILINCTIALVYLVWVNFSSSETVRRTFNNSGQRLCNYRQDPTTVQKLGCIFSTKHAELPAFRFAELACLFLAGLKIVLYLTRLPVFMTGWIEFLYNRIDYTSPKDDRLDVGDGMTVVIILFLSFIIPGVGCQIFKGPTSATDKPKFAGLVGWKSVQTKFPWGIIMLIGGSSCLGKFSDKTVAGPIAASIFSSAGDGLPGALKVQLMLIMLTIFSTHVMSNPGTSILMITVWKKLLAGFMNAKNTAMQGALILPVYSVASLCFIVPSSSIPTTLVYLNNKTDKLSPMYFLRMGFPLLLMTCIPTIIYALLNRPPTLIVTPS
ncbi:Solute carrier family 13 member 2 [Orchesella cincta]|uniref:Solute carrier family 13 member 2 n=1 Tax=Orchesella cincta TaxID=48709 RepID=A0A1D2MUK3_ORCCI|nr:Solute carrier family 13 member 2 [Orchesella cincta]